MGKIKTNRIYRNKDLETNKKYTQRRNEIITYRLFILLGLTVVIVGFLVSAMNVTGKESESFNAMSFALLIITGILFILSALFLIGRIITGFDESDKTVHSKNIFAVVLFMFFSCSLIFFTGQKWIPFLIAFTISVTILVYLYYLYQKEFFLFALFTALGCFILYLSETPLLPSVYNIAFRILLVLEAVFIFAFSLILIKNKGKLKYRIFNFQINSQILDNKAKYFHLFILAALVLVCAVLIFAALGFLGFINYFYLICAILGCFVIFGIYFTVKLI